MRRAFALGLVAGALPLLLFLAVDNGSDDERPYGHGVAYRCDRRTVVTARLVSSNSAAVELHARLRREGPSIPVLTDMAAIAIGEPRGHQSFVPEAGVLIVTWTIGHSVEEEMLDLMLVRGEEREQFVVPVLECGDDLVRLGSSGPLVARTQPRGRSPWLPRLSSGAESVR